MNRYRINQILTVLLFPFCDSLLGEEDFLFNKYLAYEAFLQYREGESSTLSMREECLSRYRKEEKKLQHYLEDKNEGRIRSYDDLLQLCELYYPLQKLREFMESKEKQSKALTAEGNQRERMALFYFNNLLRIADSMLTYRDGIAAIRTWSNEEDFLNNKDIFCMPHVFDKVEIWNLLCRFTVPDIYIVAFAVQSGLELNVLFEQKPFVSLADKLLVKSLSKGIAENHLHFNVGFDYATAWLYQVNPVILYEKSTGGKTPDKESVQCLQAAVFRMLAAAFLEYSGLNGEQSFGQWLQEYVKGKHREPLYELLYDMDHGSTKMPKEKEIVLEEVMRTINPKKKETDYDFLLETIYYKHVELRTSSEFILLYFCCRYVVRRERDAVFAHLFLQYLRIKNELFLNAQQRHGIKGLRYFQEYFAASKQLMRRSGGGKAAMLEVFRSQSKITALKKLEIRIGPSVQWEGLDRDFYKCRHIMKEQLCQQLYDILYVYRRYILEQLFGVKNAVTLLNEESKQRRGFCEILQREEDRLKGKEIVQVPGIGIVYHFIKAELLDNTTGYFCWRKVGDDAGKYSNHGLVIRERMENTAKAIEELRSTIPWLDEYIVGIDAASDENAMEPWMFAPAYVEMRSRTMTKPIMIRREAGEKAYHSVQNVGFTYHVGEDFRHIVSGLRHIDEVIERFHYKSGDRLGHAIALGINIERWVRDNEVIALPIQEYLENMLWMWGKNVYDGIDLPVQLEKLEEQILKCAGEIYKHPERLTVRMLYEAYKMKFQVKHWEILQEVLEKEEKKKNSCSQCLAHGQTEEKVFCYYSEQPCNMNGEEWNAQRLLCTNYCPVFEEKYKRVILITIPWEEVKVYECLQEYLLTKVERKGIYVETNPTSNLTIGDFEAFREHPIFKMNSMKEREEKKHHVMVMINSDDPAVFNTNVENELAYIYYATEHEGYAKEDVLRWIDRIRQNSLEGSFIQKEKNSLQILKEISMILDKLKEMK